MSLDEIYAKLPPTRCAEKCESCCHDIIQFTGEELRRMGGYDFKDGRCVHLKDGRCNVHENRPFVCRLYGSSELLRCEGCAAERYLSEEETAALVHEYVLLLEGRG